jgi:hypothetical protein
MLEQKANEPVKDDDDVKVGEPAPVVEDDPLGDPAAPIVDEEQASDEDEDDDLVAASTKAPAKNLSIKAIRGTKMFNVVDEDGVVQNAKPLSRAKAMVLAHPEE